MAWLSTRIRMRTLFRRTLPVMLLVMLLLLPLRAASGHGTATPTALWGTSAGDLAARGSSWSPGTTVAEVTDAVWGATADGATAEVLVLLRDQVDVATIPRRASRGPGERVFQALQTTAAISQAPLCAWLDARNISYRAFYIVNALLVEVDETLLRALTRRPEVAQIMTNPRVAISLPPDEPASALASMWSSDAVPWGLDKIGAPEIWALGYRGQGVVVAGQDTGYEWDHPALRGQYRGWDGGAASHDYNWHDAIHTGGSICGADSPAPCDDNGHGTHTMGTIVGDDGADHQIGIAPEARWIGCRNMSEGFGTPATYAECFEFFLAPYPVGATSAQGDPSRAPDVINNSWSCPLYEGCDAANIAFLEQVVENVRAAGILVVASAGNRGPTCGTVDQPIGMYDATFTVGATDVSDAIAAFSSRGTGLSLVKPDIVAPGVSVYSAVRGGGYTYKSGTSMASPHVVGAAALLWSARPGLRGEITRTETLLRSTAITLTSTQCGDAADAVPNNVYGWGRVDVSRVVASANSGTVAGVVRDVRGSAVEGANVRAELGAVYVLETASAADGRYVMAPVSGTYTVTVSHAGFPTEVYYPVAVSAGLTTTLNITLTRSHLLFLPIFLTTP